MLCENTSCWCLGEFNAVVVLRADGVNSYEHFDWFLMAFPICTGFIVGVVVVAMVFCSFITVLDKVGTDACVWWASSVVWDEAFIEL